MSLKFGGTLTVNNILFVLEQLALDIDDPLSMDIAKTLASMDDGGNPAMSNGDLFSAHDFDIKLDLDAKLPRKYF